MAKALSTLQKRIYQASQIDEEWPTYNQPTAFHLKGTLDINTIEKNLKTLGQIHPELGKKKIPLFTEDFSSFRKKDRFQKALEFLDSHSRDPISLNKPPFLQASIAILGPQEHLLFFNWHLIAADSHSSRLFLKQFSQLYNGKPSIKKSMSRNVQVIKESKRGSAYWKKVLESANPILELPETSSQPNEDIRKGEVVSDLLNPTLTKQLHAFEKKHKTELFRLLQTAFGAFLYRYTGQEDFIIGYPVDLRPKGMNNRFGFFLNTI